MDELANITNGYIKIA